MAMKKVKLPKNPKSVKALRNAKRRGFKYAPFVTSCSEFLKNVGYLTEEQIKVLNALSHSHNRMDYYDYIDAYGSWYERWR